MEIKKQQREKKKRQKTTVIQPPSAKANVSTHRSQWWLTEKMPMVHLGQVFDYLYVSDNLHFLQAMGRAGQHALQAVWAVNHHVCFAHIRQDEYKSSGAMKWVQKITAAAAAGAIRSVRFMDCVLPDGGIWDPLFSSSSGKALEELHVHEPEGYWHPFYQAAWTNHSIQKTLQACPNLRTLHWYAAKKSPVLSFNEIDFSQWGKFWPKLQHLCILQPRCIHFEREFGSKEEQHLLVGANVALALPGWRHLVFLTLRCVTWSPVLLKQFPLCCPYLEQLDLSGWKTLSREVDTYSFDGFGNSSYPSDPELYTSIRSILTECKKLRFFQLGESTEWGSCYANWEHMQDKNDSWRFTLFRTQDYRFMTAHRHARGVLEMIKVSPSPLDIRCIISKPRSFMWQLFRWCVDHPEFKLQSLILNDIQTKRNDLRHHLSWPDFKKPWLEKTHMRLLRKIVQAPGSLFKRLLLQPFDNLFYRYPDSIHVRFLLLHRLETQNPTWAWQERGLGPLARDMCRGEDPIQWPITDVHIQPLHIQPMGVVPYEIKLDLQHLHRFVSWKEPLQSLVLNDFDEDCAMLSTEHKFQDPIRWTVSHLDEFFRGLDQSQLTRLEMGRSVVAYEPGLLFKWCKKQMPRLRHLSVQFSSTIGGHEWACLAGFQTLQIHQLQQPQETKQSTGDQKTKMSSVLGDQEMIQLLQNNPNLEKLCLYMQKDMCIQEPETVFRHSHLRSLACHIKAREIEWKTVESIWKTCPRLVRMRLVLSDVSERASQLPAWYNKMTAGVRAWNPILWNLVRERRTQQDSRTEQTKNNAANRSTTTDNTEDDQDVGQFASCPLAIRARYGDWVGIVHFGSDY